MIKVNISGGINVGGFHYVIDASKEAHLDCISQDRYGTTNGFRKLITLDSEVSPEQFNETFIHEILESVCPIYGVKLEHEQLSSLAYGIHQVMESLGVRFVAK